MANANRVTLIGRLTRDVEVRAFASGGKVAQLGFCVNNRRKNSQTGKWDDEPVWLDCKVFQGGQNRQADLVAENCRKGSQLYIEGHLSLEQWTDNKSGEKRSKMVVIVDSFQFLDPRQEGAPRRQDSPVNEGMAPPPPSDDNDIPF